MPDMGVQRTSITRVVVAGVAIAVETVIETGDVLLGGDLAPEVDPHSGDDLALHVLDLLCSVQDLQDLQLGDPCLPVQETYRQAEADPQDPQDEMLDSSACIV